MLQATSTADIYNIARIKRESYISKPKRGGKKSIYLFNNLILLGALSLSIMLQNERCDDTAASDAHGGLGMENEKRLFHYL